jgi:hypothetical protein
VVRFDPSIDASRIDLSKTYTNEFVERAMKKYGSGQFSDDHHGFRISRLFRRNGTGMVYNVRTFR